MNNKKIQYYYYYHYVEFRYFNETLTNIYYTAQVQRVCKILY